MNKSIGVQLIVYSLLLAALSCLVHHLAPAQGRLTLIAGVAGAVLFGISGLRGVLGKGGRALPLLGLVAVSFVLLSQAVLTWGGGVQDASGQRPAAIVMTVLLALSLGMLMRIAYAGMGIAAQTGDATPARRV